MTPADARPGDIFLEHDTDLIDRIIQFGERLRDGTTHSHWNHAGVIVADTAYPPRGPMVVEATAGGVVRDYLQGVGRGEIIIIPVEPETTRAHVAAYAISRVGRKYGFAEIGCIVLALLTGTRFRFGLKGEYICSGLTAAALNYGGIDMGDDPEWTMPADLDRPGFTADVVPD